MVRQRCDEDLDVGGIAGENRFGQPERESDQMGIHHVSRARSGEDAAHRATIVERMDRHRLQEPSEPDLPTAAAPDLADDRVRGVQRCAVTESRS